MGPRAPTVLDQGDFRRPTASLPPVGQGLRHVPLAALRKLHRLLLFLEEGLAVLGAGFGATSIIFFFAAQEAGCRPSVTRTLG
jgi:hypothetical protein